MPPSWWNPRDHSIDAEPALNPGEVGPGRTPRARTTDTGAAVPTDPDPVRRRIAGERASEHPDESVDRSVFDEPAFSPETAGLDRDAGPRFSTLYRERAGETTAAKSWAVALLLAVAAGPTAIAAVFLAGTGSAMGSLSLWVTLAFLGPVTEEVLKVVGATVTLERAPWLFRGTPQFLAIGLASGLAFAAIENLLYLHLYIPDPSPQIVRWRWTVCVALHACCSAIASLGLARAHRLSRKNHQRPPLEAGFPHLATAIVVHGVYNTLALALDYAGVF